MKHFILIFFCLSSMLLSGQSGYTGNFQGVLNGDPTLITLKVMDNKVTGLYKETQNTYDITGEIRNDLLYGKIILPANQLLLGTFEAGLIPTGIHMDITLLEVTQVAVDFIRMASNINTNSNSSSNTNSNSNSNGVSSNADNYSRDPKVVGNWIKEEIINSGAGTNAAGFALVYYLKFNPDGSFSQEKGSSAGGSNWSAGSQRETDVSGQWYTKEQIMFVRPQGQKEFVRLNQYLFHEGHLVFKTPEGKYLIWNRN
ncbi:MAG: hypothetical protein ABI761_00225 [Saprospiraceae bacterium]